MTPGSLAIPQHQQVTPTRTVRNGNEGSDSLNMEASPFAFHCMICFEEFDPDRRFPVVLPCGHTYICSECSMRIERCMECRFSLFLPQPQSAAASTSTSPPGVNCARGAAAPVVWSSARSFGTRRERGLQQREKSPTPPPKKRFPLPKNVVLLSLMEATELASENARRATVSQGSPDLMRSLSSICAEEEKKGDGGPCGIATGDDDDAEKKIRICTSFAVGACGTYAVAARDGLDIVPSIPDSSGGGSSLDVSMHTANLDNMVRDVRAKQTLDDSAREKDASSLRLNYGDRIQVVSMDGGWAKLARGYGFVKADKSQLVKVREPMDKACTLEAMLHSLSIRRRKLKKEQAEVDRHSVGFLSELQTSLMNDDDLTVVAADAFPSTLKTLSHDETETNNRDVGEEAVSHKETSQVSPTTKSPMDREDSGVLQEERSVFGCLLPGLIAQSGGGGAKENRRHTRNMSQDRDMLQQASVASQVGAGAPSIFSSSTFPAPSPGRASSQTFPAPSPRRMSAGARAWRERNNRTPTTGIDFRTGLSGHMALLSSHAHPHEYLGQRPRMSMSSHSGLTPSKPRRTHGGLSQSSSPSSSPYSTGSTYASSPQAPSEGVFMPPNL